LGTGSQPYYHGGGWLPDGITTSTRVLTPGIYAPKGTWGLRPLAFSEFLGCKDVPEAMIRSFKEVSSPVAEDIIGVMVAGKCLVAGFKMLNGGGKTFVGKRCNKRPSENIGGGEIGRAKELTKRPKRTLTCGPEAACVVVGKRGVERNEPKGTETTSSKPEHRQKVSGETGLCPQKASEVLETRQESSDGRGLFTQTVSEWTATTSLKIGHRQKASGKIRLCPQKASDVLETRQKVSDERGIGPQKVSKLPEICPQTELGKGSKIHDSIIHDNNTSIQNDGNWSEAPRRTHNTENNNSRHEDNNPSSHNNSIIQDDNTSIQNDGNCSKITRRTHDTEHNKSSREDNNPSSHNDENYVRSYDADSVVSADDKPNGLSAVNQESPSNEKSAIFRDEARGEINEKERIMETGEALKTPTENEPFLTGGTKEVLHGIAREKRERKATKADDADVPEYLWGEHLLKDCPTPWVRKERTRFRRAIRLLRARMLKWWKQRVT
jgi:hypothetical protein